MTYRPSNQRDIGDTAIIGHLNHAPDLSNRSHGWGGIVADVHKWSGAGEAMSLAPGHDIVAMRIAGSTPLVQRRGGKVDERIVTYGNVTVHPTGMDSHWSWTKSGTIMLMRLPPEMISEVHQHVGSNRDLPNRFGFRDPGIEQYVKLLNMELQSGDGPSKPLRWQSLSLAVCAYVIENLADRSIDSQRAGGLAPMALRKVTEYIGDNWKHQPSLQELADVAGVTRFHFARMFKISMGLTVMDFVEISRLDRARDLITQGNLSLAEIALITGFSDQSHFARRFRRAFGESPGIYARTHSRRSVLAR